MIPDFFPQRIDDILLLKPGMILKLYGYEIIVTEQNRDAIVDDFRGCLESIAAAQAGRWWLGLSWHSFFGKMHSLEIFLRVWVKAQKWHRLTHSEAQQ